MSSGNSGNSSNTEANNMSSGNSGKSSNTERKKLNLRIDSSDNNVIDHNSKIGGICILGDNGGKIDDKPVPGDNGVKIDDKPVPGDSSNSSLPQGFNISDYDEVEFRINSGDKNKIGAYCEIQRDSFVGDGAARSIVVQRNITMNKQGQQPEKK